MGLSTLKRYWWAFIATAVVVAVGAILLTGSGNNLFNRIFPPQFPTCPSGLSGILTASPIDLDSKLFSVIFPLGNLNPPAHMIPTDHIYLGVFASDEDMNQKVAIYAPGDIWLTKLHTSQITSADGTTSSDYGIQFTACRGVVMEFGHVTELSPDLEQLMKGVKGECREGKKPAGERNVQCEYYMNQKVRAGDVVGYVSGAMRPRGNVIMDFYSWNTNAPSLAFANPRRYGDTTLHAFCPLDMYAGDLKESLYQKLGGLEWRRTIEPVCGEIMQDVKGTALGNWFGVPDTQRDYGTNAIALVHENGDPSIAVISVGGGFYDSGKLSFSPRSNGQTNRDFREITADGNIYCFQSELQSGSWDIPGKVLVQLIDDDHLKIEHKESNCTGSETFSNPYTYQR
jgi:hypothetical protein